MKKAQSGKWAEGGLRSPPQNKQTNKQNPPKRFGGVACQANTTDPLAPIVMGCGTSKVLAQVRDDLQQTQADLEASQAALNETSQHLEITQTQLSQREQELAAIHNQVSA